MTGRREAPPLGSAARDATASPYIGKRRAGGDEHIPCPHCGGCLTCRIHLDPPDDPPRCESCAHFLAGECGCSCCGYDNDHTETPDG